MSDERAQETTPTRTPEPDGLVCPHCIEPVHELDHFCPHCNGPITSHAAIDPLGQVYAAGRAYQNATDRPSRLTVVAMWLIFGPQLPVLLLGMGVTSSQLFWPHGEAVVSVGAAAPQSAVFTLFGLAVCLGLASLYGAILAKVTWRRWRGGEAA
jgi:hypothetical protein